MPQLYDVRPGFNSEETRIFNKLHTARQRLHAVKPKLYQMASRGINKKRIEHYKRIVDRHLHEPEFLYVRRGWSLQAIDTWMTRRIARVKKLVETEQARIDAILLRRDLLHTANGLPADHATALLNIITQQTTEEGRKTLTEIQQTLRRLPLAKLDAAHSDICEAAAEFAHGAGFMLALSQLEQLGTASFLNLKTSAWKAGIQMLATARIPWRPHPGMTERALFARLSDAGFCRKHLAKAQNEVSIELARQLGILGHGGKTSYLPKDVTQRIEAHDAATREWSQCTVLQSSNGKTKHLSDILDGAEERQLAELQVMTLARAAINAREGLTARIVTITTPSRFHPTRTVRVRDSAGRKIWTTEPNPRWSGETVQDARRWRADLWKLFRARLRSRGLKAGPSADWDVLTATEPHADATPHWHALLWFRPEHEELITRELRELFLYENGACSELEPGAQRHRVKIEVPRRPWAVRAYILKTLGYITKTRQEAATAKEAGNTAAAAAKRAEAAYCRATRQRRIACSQIGATIYRFLRKVRDPSTLPQELHEPWRASHGLPVDAQLEPGRPHRTTPEDAVRFLDSIAREYQPIFTFGDYFDTKFMSWHDYLTTTPDPKTGELDAQTYTLTVQHPARKGRGLVVVDGPEEGEHIAFYERDTRACTTVHEVHPAAAAAWDRVQVDAARWHECDFTAGVISRTRKVTRYGEPKKPSPASAKSIGRKLPSGGWIVADNPDHESWEIDEEATNAAIAALRDKKIREITARAHTALQLSVCSQGDADASQNRMNADFQADDVDAAIAALDAEIAATAYSLTQQSQPPP